MGPKGFRDLGRMAIYFQGALVFILGEQAHSFGDLESSAKNQKNTF